MARTMMKSLPKNKIRHFDEDVLAGFVALAEKHDRPIRPEEVKRVFFADRSRGYCSESVRILQARGLVREVLHYGMSLGYLPAPEDERREIMQKIEVVTLPKSKRNLIPPPKKVTPLPPTFLRTLDVRVLDALVALFGENSSKTYNSADIVQAYFPTRSNTYAHESLRILEKLELCHHIDMGGRMGFFPVNRDARHKILTDLPVLVFRGGSTFELIKPAGVPYYKDEEEAKLAPEPTPEPTILPTPKITLAPTPTPEPKPGEKALGFKCEVCAALMGVKAGDNFTMNCPGCDSTYLIQHRLAHRLHPPIKVKLWFTTEDN